MTDQTTLVPISEAEKALADFTNLKDTRKMLSLSAGFITATYREYKAAETRYKATGLPEAKEERDYAYQSAVKAGELRLWTEAKIGELIKLEQAAGRLAKQGGDRRTKNQSNTGVTLKDIGLTKMDSMRAQKVFEHKDLIPVVTEKALKSEDTPTRRLLEDTIAEILKERQEKERQSKRQELAKAGVNLVPPEGIRIEIGKFQELGKMIPDNSIDLIFTDPNYAQEYLSEWSELSKLAARVLKPGRFLLAYSGQVFLREVMDALDTDLEYYWMAGKYHDQGHQTIWSHKVWGQWKPILIYKKPGEDSDHDFFVDMLRMGTRKEAKELHNYGQSIEDARYYLQKFTKEDDIILDPFMGSGTIILAAKQTKRKAIGFEENEETANSARGRVSD